MNIAIDYDSTYTQDPELWNEFIASSQARGHSVICVTMRYPDCPEERIEGLPIPVYYTGRGAKMPFVKRLDLHVDVWIDDNPAWIYLNAGDYEGG
jgi:hypothetical protein